MDLYTIGHTTQSQEDLLDMLNAFHVNCIVDVRSSPYSQYAPQFNQGILRDFLSGNGVLYAHFGKEFGARRNDCLKEAKQKDGSEALQVNFELGMRTDNFKAGINRLDNALSQGRNHSLMLIRAEGAEVYLDNLFFKQRVKFSFNGSLYDFPITDPEFLERLKRDYSLFRTYDTLYVVVSLGLVHEGCHYKLAATLIMPQP